MLVDTSGLTSRCCYLKQNDIAVAPGNNTLYFRHDVITICTFGYDRSTGCQGCLQDYWVSAEYLFLNNDGSGQNGFLEFNLYFGGPDCSEITGMNYALFL